MPISSKRDFFAMQIWMYCKLFSATQNYSRTLNWILSLYWWSAVMNLYCCFAVDFVLKDPREKDENKKEQLPPHREELAVVPKPWNKSYVQALDLAAQQLHVTNPCLLQLLQLWHTTFRYPLWNLCRQHIFFNTTVTTHFIYTFINLGFLWFLWLTLREGSVIAVRNIGPLLCILYTLIILILNFYGDIIIPLW